MAKAPFLRLLLGLYLPNAGTIQLIASGNDQQKLSIDGINMNRYTSYVPSDRFIFAGTIRENVIMNAEHDEALLRQSIALEDIRDFIDILPKGLDEQIGAGIVVCVSPCSR